MCIRDRYQRRVRGGSETVRMLTEHGKALHQTWEALPRRSGEQLPVWQDIKAACIAPIMKHLWVLEYQPPEALIVRFMGSEVVRIGGQDNTGKDFLRTRTLR
eukprot:TRINITY_DN291_c0_g1_i9.p1 TRINITY_DN291_c0_g1~~TRINITY_DN291_c0_g1_i9.p1  ORF type:complete len:102 (-),score=19.68 TRINITY_DN291_c0_g1_i9:93-398(-)